MPMGLLNSDSASIGEERVSSTTQRVDAAYVRFVNREWVTPGSSLVYA